MFHVGNIGWNEISGMGWENWRSQRALGGGINKDPVTG